MATTGERGQQGEQPRLRRDVRRTGLLFAGVGSIIGSGWLFGPLEAAHTAGPAAVFSWAIATVMILLIGLCYAELGTMFPISGGVVRFPHLSFGSFGSYTMGWITWVATVAVAPIEVEAVTQYANGYINSIGLPEMMSKTTVEGDDVYTLTGFGGIVAVLLMALFTVINYMGVKYFAQLNNVLVWWKLAVIIVVIVIFLYFAVTSGHMGQNFTKYGFMPGGWEGVFSAISTAGITFSFLGFRQGIELAGETNNPKKNVPFAVIGSVLLCGIIYVVLEVAFIGTVQPKDLLSSHGWEQLAFANDFGPLAAIAGALGLGWLAVVLYIDAVVSPGDTGLIYNTITARMSYAMGRNRNAPLSLAKVNKRGTPWVSLFIGFLVGLFFFLPFPSWQYLVSFITSATVLSFGSGPLVLAAMRRQIPNRPRVFRVPGGDIIPFLAFFSANMIVFWGGWATNWKLFVAVLLGFVLLPIFNATAKHNLPPMNFRAAFWVLPWLVGLALISFLGDYDGGMHVLNLGWGALATLALTVLIYSLAVRVNLSGDEVERNITETHEEARQEAAVLDAE